jgi:hypothetical protein
MVQKIVLLALGLAAVAVPLHADHDFDYGDPSAAEQLMLELVNRARMDPEAERQRLGIPEADWPGYAPRPPLAMNARLLAAARAHAQDMHDRRFFDHPNPDGLNANGRIRAEGYRLAPEYPGDTVNNTENIAIGPDTAEAAHRLLFVDESRRPPAGNWEHRQIILSDLAITEPNDEVGIGIFVAPEPVSIPVGEGSIDVRHFYVQEFAHDAGPLAFTFSGTLDDGTTEFAGALSIGDLPPDSSSTPGLGIYTVDTEPAFLDFRVTIDGTEFAPSGAFRSDQIFIRDLAQDQVLIIADYGDVAFQLVLTAADGTAFDGVDLPSGLESIAWEAMALTVTDFSVDPLVAYAGSVDTLSIRAPLPFLLGVAYRDENANGRYDLNEGLGGVTVETTEGGYSTTTASAGGYAIPIEAPGDYTVRASGGGLEQPIETQVTVEDESVKVDFRQKTPLSFEALKSVFKVNFKKRVKGITADVLVLKALLDPEHLPETLGGAEVSIQAGDVSLGPFTLEQKGTKGRYRSPKGQAPRIKIDLKMPKGLLVLKVAQADLMTDLEIEDETLLGQKELDWTVTVGEFFEAEEKLTYDLKSTAGKKAKGKLAAE